MSSPPTIDLHPDKIRGSGPESALSACRDFLDKALAAGHRQVRIVTGLGLRGDGTPRLRMRVEAEVLPAYHRYIEDSAHEQGGAVIRLHLRPADRKPTAAWHRHQRHVGEREGVADRESRLEVAYDRLEAADEAFDEGDLRRCRIKLNQVAREFGWDTAAPDMDAARLAGMLDGHWDRLRTLDR